MMLSKKKYVKIETARRRVIVLKDLRGTKKLIVAECGRVAV